LKKLLLLKANILAQLGLCGVAIEKKFGGSSIIIIIWNYVTINTTNNQA